VAEIEVSDTWLKFWHETMLALYEGTNPKNKYIPPHSISKIMVKYKITEIKQQGNTKTPKNIRG
jgi:hypothetical protein